MMLLLLIEHFTISGIISVGESQAMSSMKRRRKSRLTTVAST